MEILFYKKNDILLLINDCDLVINYKNKINEEFVKDVQKLKRLCQNALSNNKFIICL